MSKTGYIPTSSGKGQRKKPTALAVLENTKKGESINRSEVAAIKSGAFGAAQMPEWLAPDAKAEWERLAPRLEMLGLLTDQDTNSFAAYCQAYAKWKEAEEFINQNGSIVRTPAGYWQAVPQVSISMQNLKIMLAFSSRFGLTPSDRSKLELESMPNSADPLDQLLSE